MKAYNPYPYQQYCEDKLISQPKAALFLDMGMGKTVVTLTALYKLKYYYFALRWALVIAPKKVAEDTWTTEAAKWDHLRGLRVAKVLGTEKQRIAALATPADVYVINRDNVQWLVRYFGRKWPFDAVVLDESTSFKNSQTKRFKAIRSVLPKIQRIIELTGTPSPKGYEDLWAQIYLLDGGNRLGRTLSVYRDVYFEPDQRSRTTIFSYKLKPGAKEEIDSRLADICVSLRAEDYLALPPIMYQTIPVVLDGAAQRAYDQMERDMVLDVTKDGTDATEITANTAGILAGKLLQLCNGAVYDENGEVHEIHSAKIEAFMETVEGLHGEHALVFYTYKHDLERLQAALRPTGLRVRVYAGPDDKAAWDAGGVDILLAHPASCCYGLNLQAGGRHIIWFGLTYSLELFLQGNKRLHRQGQEKPVMIHLLAVKGGADEDVIQVLETRNATQEGLLEALRVRVQRVKGGQAA